LVASDGVDAMLLMAGARSTLIAGQIAMARPLPILAVDEFDGSAGVIRTELAISTRDYPSAATHSITEMVTWLKIKCDAQAEQRAQTRLRESSYHKGISQTQKVLWAAGAFLALLLTFFFGLGQPSEPKFYASLLLGGVAGFVAGLAYLVPQYVGKYGVLDPAATKVEATDRIPKRRLRDIGDARLLLQEPSTRVPSGRGSRSRPLQ
jgi:hypothetical protein